MDSRCYYIPMFSHCVEQCSYCEGLGCVPKKDKTLFEFKQSLHKAKKGEYNSLLFPCNFLFHHQFKTILQEAKNSDLKIKIKLNSKSIHSKWKDFLKSIYFEKLSFVLVMDHINEDLDEMLEFFKQNNMQHEFLLPIVKDQIIKPVLEYFNDYGFEDLFVYFPFHLKTNDNHLDTKEVYQKINWIKKSYPSFKIKTYPGIDNFDARINPQLNLEPYLLPDIENTLNNGSLKYSVVIPTYNFKNYIVNTLRHLFLQNFDPKDFEVIVVDDGSTDHTEEFIEQELAGDIKKYNFKYIYFPRAFERSMGDGAFRAGIARNLGVKHARGEYVCFLDSDILTDKNFLKNLYSQHQQFDLIQTKRHYLNKKKSSICTNYNDIDINKDTFIPEGGYWHKFYNDSIPWNDRPSPWKFACTYCLSMKTSVFKKLGWFKKNYHFYGFEDTDLGYRFYINGYKFHLSDEIVYHLHHSNERSEYKNSNLHRMQLLKKSAKTFYLNHLDPKIYENLGRLVQPDFKISKLKRRLKNLFNNELC